MVSGKAVGKQASSLSIKHHFHRTDQQFIVTDGFRNSVYTTLNYICGIPGSVSLELYQLVDLHQFRFGLISLPCSQT